MLSHLSAPKSSNVHEVSRMSLSSGKSGMPFVGAGVVAYPNSYNTQGDASRITVIDGSVKDGFRVRVLDRDDRRQFTRTVYSKVGDSAAISEHVFQDLRSGNHRLYSAESCCGRGRDPNMENLESGQAGRAGNVSFTDGVSAVLAAVEWLTGEKQNSCFAPAPVSMKVGCKSNMPTLESVVFGMASRHVRVRRPAGSKSFASGMATTETGGAKLPSNAEQARRLRESAERALERATEALELGQLETAEETFKQAEKFESRAIVIQAVVNDRMGLLRQRAAAARARKSESLAQAKADASA